MTIHISSKTNQYFSGMVGKPGICQSGWYVFGICQKKKSNAVYNAVNTYFDM